MASCIFSFAAPFLAVDTVVVVCVCVFFLSQPMLLMTQTQLRSARSGTLPNLDHRAMPQRTAGSEKN